MNTIVYYHCCAGLQTAFFTLAYIQNSVQESLFCINTTNTTGTDRRREEKEALSHGLIVLHKSKIVIAWRSKKEFEAAFDSLSKAGDTFTMFYKQSGQSMQMKQTWHAVTLNDAQAYDRIYASFQRRSMVLSVDETKLWHANL